MTETAMGRTFLSTLMANSCVDAARMLIVAVAASVLGLFSASAHAQSTKAIEPLRLDRPLSNSEACVVVLGTGPNLRVPKSLFPIGYCESNKQPIPAPRLSMSFWFPDMTPTPWQGVMEVFREKQSGTYVPQTDRFRVRVVWLFYPTQFPNATYKDWDGPEPQVWQMLARPRDQYQYKAPIYQKSDFPGLGEIHFGAPISSTPALIKEAKEKGWNLISQRKSYVEVPGSKYSLLMSCDEPNGIDCEAHVQIKKTKLQYRITFPSEAIYYSTDLINVMNKMIDSWLEYK